MSLLDTSLGKVKLFLRQSDAGVAATSPPH